MFYARWNWEKCKLCLIGDKFSHLAVECTNCGHLDTRMVRECPVCGHATREIEDVTEAVIPAAIQRDIELLYVKEDPDFDRAGNIAALLRFRADQSKGRDSRRVVDCIFIMSHSEAPRFLQRGEESCVDDLRLTQ